jgi:hypothetical protein
MQLVGKNAFAFEVLRNKTTRSFIFCAFRHLLRRSCSPLPCQSYPARFEVPWSALTFTQFFRLFSTKISFKTKLYSLSKGWKEKLPLYNRSLWKIGSVTVERISPVARFDFVVPVSVASTFDSPRLLAEAFFEFGTFFGWEVDGVAAFVVSALDVEGSFQLLLRAIGFALGQASKLCRAEFLATLASFLSSNSVVAWHIFGARLCDDCFGFSGWRTNDCSWRRVRIKDGIWRELRLIFRWCSLRCWATSTRFNAKRFNSRIKYWCFQTLELVLFAVDASDEMTAISWTRIDIDRVNVWGCTIGSFTDSKAYQKH